MKCSFCGKNMERGTGQVFVTKEGGITYLCSSKCGKNLLKLKRKPQKVKWTARSMQEKMVRKGEEKKVVKKVEKVKKKKTTREERRKERERKKTEKKKKKEEIKKKKPASEQGKKGE